LKPLVEKFRTGCYFHLNSTGMIASFLSRHRMWMLHVSFWLAYVAYTVYELQSYLGWATGISYVSFRLAFLLTACYLHYFLVLPLWLTQKKTSMYFLWLLVLLIGIVSLRIFAENLVMPQLMKNETYYLTIKLSRVISTCWDTLVFLMFTGMIRFTIDRFDLESRQQQLENEKLVAELNYLKAQINPHFLFNTLHNLNYLVYAGSVKATEVIIKLSNIMRYMIYEAHQTHVPLIHEINYINDYIHLESLRLSQSVSLTFEREGSMENVRIAPLTLITLLENAFKHGVRDTEKDCWIKMMLKIEGSTIYYHVSNRILTTDPTRQASGFGLKNLQRRLNLGYPNRHRLNIDNQNGIYTVQLELR
jgi:sensor histidine kinase YesM